MRRILVAAGAAVLLAGSGCGPRGQLASPSGGAAASDASHAAATTDSRTLMDGGFVHAWPDNPRGTAWVVDGGYRMASRQPGQFVAVRAPLAEAPRDVIVSGTFHKVAGPAGGGYGLIVSDQGLGAGDGRDQSGQFVVAEVGDRGEIGVWRRDGERWFDLVSWTASRAVHTDARANDLSVQLIGDRLSFVVNGERVAELDRATAGWLGTGGVGVFTGGDMNEVAVTRFRVQAPASGARPGAAQPPPTRPQPPSNKRPDGDPKLPDRQRIQELLGGIAEDLIAVGQSFSGGPDDPHGPVSDSNTLRRDQEHLAGATDKAFGLLSELRKIQGGAADDG